MQFLKIKPNRNIKSQIVYSIFNWKKSIVFWSILGLSLNLSAQSDNYWSWNFNTPSTLMAGTVVAGGAGPSAIFYNPALIDRDNVASLSISASLISVQSFKIKNIAGDGIDANNINFAVQPRFFSFVLPRKNEKLGIEFAYISPFSEDISYAVQHVSDIDIIKRMEGLERYNGSLDYSRKYNDRLGGFGFSYELPNNFFVGVSSFLSFKNLKYNNKQLATAYQQKDSVIVDQNLEPSYIAQRSFEEELKYWDVSLIMKAGVQYLSKNDRFRIGLNLTFPNVPILGQADVRKSYSNSNVFDDTANSFTPNEIIVENEENVKTNVKTPFSVALGLQYITKEHKNLFSFTIEYFHEISPYMLIETSNDPIELPEYLSQFIGDSDFLSYYTEANSVINAGIGFKQHLTTTFYLFGGFRTDFTAGLTDDIRFIGDKFKVSQVDMNLFHITLGPVLTIRRSEVVLGVQYTIGRNKELPQVVNYLEPVEYIPSTGQALEGIIMNNADASKNEVAFFLGITVDLFYSEKQ